MDHQVLGNIRTISEHQEISWEEITGIRYRRLGPGNLFIDQSESRDWRPIIDQSERRDWNAKEISWESPSSGPGQHGVAIPLTSEEGRPIIDQSERRDWRPIIDQSERRDWNAKEISWESPSSGPDKYIIDQSEKRNPDAQKKKKNRCPSTPLHTRLNKAQTRQPVLDKAQDNWGVKKHQRKKKSERPEHKLDKTQTG
jgi:hypothetical protein